MSRTRRLVRLFAVVAILAGVLVPAAAASAQLTDYDCDEENFHTSNPDHILYGRSNAGQAVDGTKMVVDLRGMTPSGSGFLVAWDRYFVPGTDGVIVYGSSYNDTICGTWGDDWIWGYMGNDRILGFDSATNYSSATYTPAGGSATTPWVGFGDHLSGGKGHDFITSGDGNGLADVNDDDSARIGGGMGNDVIYLGGDDDNDNCLPSPIGCADGTPTARGGEGDDVILLGYSDTDNFMMKGGSGNDYLQLCDGDDGFAYGGAGDDIIVGGGRNDADEGTAPYAYDWLCGGGGGDDNDVFGNNGADQIFGNGEDGLRAFGGQGADWLWNGDGERQGLFGNAGDDHIGGMGDGYDAVADGGDGNDVITSGDFDYSWGWGAYGFMAFGGSGDDTIVGGSNELGQGEDDCLFGDYADATGDLYDENGAFSPFESYDCSDQNVRGISDPFFVDPDATGNDTIWGYPGNDLLRGGPGNDSIWGNYPKPGMPNAGLDVSDRNIWTGDDGDDWLGGGDGDDFLYGNACFLAGDWDFANGGGDAVSGDTTHGFTTVFVTTQNVEHYFDQSVCLVVDP